MKLSASNLRLGNNPLWRGVLGCALCWAAISGLQAHTPSETFLTLRIGQAQLSGQWEVAFKDLQQALGAGAAGRENNLTNTEERQRRQEALVIDTLALLNIRANGQTVPLQVFECDLP